MSVLALAGWISVVFLALGAFGALYRVIRGPAVLARAIAVDVMLIVFSSGLVVRMALNDPTYFIIIVGVASLIAFISSTILARFTREGANANQSAPEPKQPRAGGDI